LAGFLRRQISVVLIVCTCAWSFVPCNAQTQIYWKLGMTAAQMKQTVALNTEVVFKWSGFHNVYELPDKKAFDACDFSKAKELASHRQGSFTYKASSSGIVYFACQVSGHCSVQKLALTVTGGEVSVCQPCKSSVECGKDRFCCPNQKLCIPNAHSNCLCPNEDSAASKHSNNDRVHDSHKCGSKACYFCPGTKHPPTPAGKSSGQQNLRLSKSEQKRQKKKEAAEKKRQNKAAAAKKKQEAASKKKVAAAKKKEEAAAKKKAAADKKKQNKVAAAKKKKEAAEKKKQNKAAAAKKKKEAAEKKRAAKKEAAEAKKKKKQEKKGKKKGKKKKKGGK